MNHAFTLEVSGIDTGRENYEDALYEAGCDDALIAVVNGTMFIDFDRDGLSFQDAVKPASHDVELTGGKVVRVVPRISSTNRRSGGCINVLTMPAGLVKGDRALYTSSLAPRTCDR
jgi:hypothetical protein